MIIQLQFSEIMGCAIQIFLFPIKKPFRAEQLTKNLIQWLWIDYIDCYVKEMKQTPILSNLYFH